MLKWSKTRDNLNGFIKGSAASRPNSKVAPEDVESRPDDVSIGREWGHSAAGPAAAEGSATEGSAADLAA